MAFIYTPAYKVFEYKKYISPQNTTQGIVFDFNSIKPNTRNLEIIGLPTWLEAVNIIANKPAGLIDFEVRVITNVADTLAVGHYSANIKMKGQYDASSGWRTFTSPTYCTINLIVSDTKLLSVTPSVMAFTYEIGQPAPDNKIMQLVSETNWNITLDQTWLTAAPINGLENAQVIIGVDPSGLPIGNYSGNVIVKDNYFEKNMPVTLTITGIDTETDFLYLNPTNLEFITEFEIPYTGTKTLSIEASGNWAASESVAWLQLSATSGSAGTTSIDVSLANNDAFDVGTLTTSITFTMGDIVKTVYVTFIVVEFFEEGIESEGFYYALDRNKLKITNILDNNYLQLGVTATNGTGNKQYTQEAPYLNGVSSVVIGQETEVLQPDYTPTDNFTTRIINPVSPVVYAINASNINKTTNSETAIKSYTNVRFLKGYTPTVENKLCYIPESIFVTKNAILSLVLRTDETPESIEITGDVTATLSASAIANKYVYQTILNLADVTLEAGNAITITFGSLVINATIIKTEPEVNTIAFLNEWNYYEFFETTGFLTRTPEANKTTTEIATEGKKHTKIVSIDLVEQYTLDTGWIYTQAEKEWLANILNSQRIFIYLDGQPVEVTLTTKNLEVYKTREHTKSYALKFKKAII